MSGENIIKVRDDGAEPAESGPGTESKSAKDTGTRGRRGRRGRSTGSTGEEKEKLPGVAAVDADEEAKREERNRKRRERYAANKSKPKKVKKSELVNTTDIANILGALSHVLATRPEMAHWQLTPDEINKLSLPLSNIMDKSGVLTELGEHADAIALVTACFTIFAPRIAISVANYKIKKEVNKFAGSNKISDGTGKDRTRQESEAGKSGNGSNTDATKPVENDSNEQLYIGAALAY